MNSSLLRIIDCVRVVESVITEKHHVNKEGDK